MRFAAFILVILASALSGTAQEADLPDELKPDPAHVAVAGEMGVEVFKLLPRGMFADPQGSSADSENFLGVREGGAYYSFSTRSHSYNRVPQIGLEQDQLSTGFAGLDYGFLIDIGRVPLNGLNADKELEFLSDYKPPVREEEIRAEQMQHNYRVDGLEFNRRLPAVEGHTYLLRAISYGEKDKLVAFHILHKSNDGGLTIVWRNIKDFETPRFLRKSDEVLGLKVKAVLKEMKAEGVKYSVDGEIVKLEGAIESVRYAELLQRVAALGPRGIQNNVKRK